MDFKWIIAFTWIHLVSLSWIEQVFLMFCTMCKISIYSRTLTLLILIFILECVCFCIVRFYCTVGAINKHFVAPAITFAKYMYATNTFDFVYVK